mgnify:CR=1 FL=1
MMRGHAAIIQSPNLKVEDDSDDNKIWLRIPEDPLIDWVSDL